MSIVNPNAVPVTISYDWYTTSGTFVATSTFTIPAKGTQSVTGASQGISTTTGSVIVRSPLPVKGYVVTYNWSGNASNSYSWAASSPYTFHPQPPNGLTVTGNAGSVTLNWQLSGDDPLNALIQPKGTMDVIQYNIMRSTALGSTYTQIGTVQAGTNTYTDSTAVVGTTYFYQIQAVATPRSDGTQQITESPESAGVAAH